MAHEAAVRLTLDGSQFMVSIKRAGDEVDKVGKKGKKSFDLFGSAAAGARRSIGNLGGAIKNTLALAGSLGGAFTVGAGIKSALQLQTTYQRLSFGIRSATGNMMTHVDVQKLVERSAAATGRTNAEMAESFGQLMDATGELDFSTKVLETLGHVSMATGAELGTLVTLADQLHTKFNVSADSMGDAIAQLYQLTKFKGGPKLEEIAEFAGKMGAELLAAGLEGKRGIDFMVGSLKATDDPMGNIQAQVKGIRMLLRGLGNQSDLKDLAKNLGIDPKSLINEKDAIARLRKVLGFGAKGVKALTGSMKEGEEKQAMEVLFTKPFEDALAEAQKSGLKGKAAIDQALLVFDKQIGEFGKANMTAADMLEEAARMRQTPEAQLNAALNTLSTALGDPAIVGAINDLAAHLPALAKLFGEFVSFAAKNPILSGALALGGKVGVDAAGGAARAIFEGHRAGGTALTGALGEGTATLKSGVKDAFGSVSGLLGAAGQAFGIAASAYLAFKVGQEWIDNNFDEQNAAGDTLRNATLARKPRSAEEREQQIAAIEAGIKGTESTGHGVLDTMLRGTARVGAMTTGQLSSSVPDTRVSAEQDRADARDKIEELRQLRFGETTVEPRAPMSSTAPGTTPAVKLDVSGQRTIGVAVATALGGQVLGVRITNGSELGLGRANAGPGGSRGPMAAGTPRAGGGV